MIFGIKMFTPISNTPNIYTLDFRPSENSKYASGEPRRLYRGPAEKSPTKERFIINNQTKIFNLLIDQKPCKYVWLYKACSENYQTFWITR